MDHAGNAHSNLMVHFLVNASFVTVEITKHSVSMGMLLVSYMCWLGVYDSKGYILFVLQSWSFELLLGKEVHELFFCGVLQALLQETCEEAVRVLDEQLAEARLKVLRLEDPAVDSKVCAVIITTVIYWE